MPKNAQTTTQLHSSHMLVMVKILQASLLQYMDCEHPDVQAGFRKGRGTSDQIANIRWIIKEEQSFRKTSISALLTMPNTLCESQQTMKNSERYGNTRPPDLPLEKSLCRSGSNS